jgi:hypothetical protein
MTKLNVSYFERPGRNNTEATLKIALRRAEELDIGTVIVASSTGETGVRACEVFKGRKVVVVGSFTGFRRPNEQRFSPENRATVERSGGIVLTASHVFTGVSRAAYLKFGTAGVDEIVRGVLYMFGQGMKVCCEIALMAADAGAVRIDEEVISIGGTGRGADTAVVLQPVNLRDFFDLRIREVLCKTR